MLNLFYQEPETDRWLPFDRYPRRIVRRLLRGRARVMGQRRMFLNLCAGLDRLRIPYRVNDFKLARRNPSALACVIGKPFVLDKLERRNPILFGAAVHSHPVDAPDLLERYAVKKVLVPGGWMKDMCAPYWGSAVESWPVGIDSDSWRPQPASEKTIDVLLYDKVRWRHDEFELTLIEPIRAHLRESGRSFWELRYGAYREEQFKALLARCRAMIFLCEHETQGLAYQQALSCGVPILAWDRGGFWQDPAYFPHRVRYAPVTSVPYWDDRCGATFGGVEDFAPAWERFWADCRAGRIRPRDYILENLTLEKCARRYADIAASVGA